MKKILLFLTLISITFTQAQIVNIPDANFKNALLNHSPVIDTNGDDEIQVDEAVAFSGNLYVSNSNISDLTGIEYFTNITSLDCGYNQLTNLDLSNNLNLTNLECFSNELNSLNVSNNTNLINLQVNNNLLTSLDLSNNINITELDCGHNLLTSLDLSNLNIEILYCNINQLVNLNISNQSRPKRFKFL